MRLQSIDSDSAASLVSDFHPVVFVPGKYHCPVLYNVFTNNSHIVANKVTGNVFSHEVRRTPTLILTHK